LRTAMVCSLSRGKLQCFPSPSMFRISTPCPIAPPKTEKDHESGMRAPGIRGHLRHLEASLLEVNLKNRFHSRRRGCWGRSGERRSVRPSTAWKGWIALIPLTGDLIYPKYSASTCLDCLYFFS
jgi:hypothetical protein